MPEEKTTVKTTVKTTEMVLAELQQNPDKTLAEISIKTGKSLRVVERAAQKLVKEGKLRYVGPKKGGHWEILI